METEQREALQADTTRPLLLPFRDLNILFLQDFRPRQILESVGLWIFALNQSFKLLESSFVSLQELSGSRMLVAERTCIGVCMNFDHLVVFERLAWTHDTRVEQWLERYEIKWISKGLLYGNSEILTVAATLFDVAFIARLGLRLIRVCVIDSHYLLHFFGQPERVQLLFSPLSFLHAFEHHRP